MVPELKRTFPELRVGRRGNDHSDTFRSAMVIVSVVNSAREWQVGPVPPGSLLVADECHRYGAAGNARALRDEFKRRLGLTATFAREDGGCESYLAPYFGDTCFRMGYAQAIEDEVTAHFKVALVGVDFDSDEERAEYEKAAKEGSSARKWLTSHGWAVEEPFGEFMKDVAKLAEQAPIHNGRGDRYTAVGHALDYMRSFSARRKLLADTASKNEAIGELVPAVKAASRTIVFTETIATAVAADPDVFGRLGKYKGGKRVDTGANLLLWRPFDPSVLAGSSSEDASALKVTSAIQTFLDLKKLAGRGEEAAAAVFERLLAGPLRDAADQNKEMRHDGLQSDHPGISPTSRRR